MDAIRTMMRKLFADKRGATAIEYGLIAALIGVAIITSLNALGGKSGGMWDKLNNAVSRV